MNDAISPDEERNLEMERIETINLKTETDALEAGHGITLYTFDEYGRLMHYAHIVASTPKEREDGYADYFLTIFKGGDDMRRFDPDDGNDYPNFESIIESIKTIWSNTPIWWERDGSVPGVDAGITFDELRGASMLAGFRRQLERNMRVRGIDPEGGDELVEIMAGTFIICGFNPDSGEDTSLTPQQAEYWMRRFHEPETFVQTMDGSIHAIHIR